MIHDDKKLVVDIDFEEKTLKEINDLINEIRELTLHEHNFWGPKIYIDLCKKLILTRCRLRQINCDILCFEMESDSVLYSASWRLFVSIEGSIYFLKDMNTDLVMADQIGEVDTYFEKSNMAKDYVLLNKRILR